MHICTSFLLLYNKLCRWEQQKHLLSHNFHWSEIWAWVSWVFCSALIKLTSQYHLGLRSHLQLGVLFQAYWLLAEFNSFVIGLRPLVCRGHTPFPALWLSLWPGSLLLQSQEMSTWCFKCLWLLSVTSRPLHKKSSWLGQAHPRLSLFWLP